jgi:hypothetical protein
MSPTAPLRPALVLALGALLGACAPTQPEPELVTLDLISVNGLSAAAVEANGSALDALASGPLDGAETTLADTDDGRSLFGYLAGCALAPGESAELPLPDGQSLLAAGKLGFAPGWRDGPIGAVDRRWVSACVIGHVNAFELHVPLSVRAAVLSGPDAIEAGRYDVQEAAFYGDLFAADPADRHMNACFGYDVAAELGADGDIDGGEDGGVGDDTLDYLRYRVCSTSDDCGFNRTGACFNWGPPIEGTATSACDDADGNLYVDCHDKPVDDNPTATWSETVTIHLQRVDFDRQLAEYQAQDQPCTPSDPNDGGAPNQPQDAGAPPSPQDAGIHPEDAGVPPIPNLDAGHPGRDGGTSIHALRASCPTFE